MPNPSQAHYRIEISGQIGTGGVWATSLNVAAQDNIAPTLAEFQEFTDNLAPYVNTLWSDGVSFLCSGDTSQNLLRTRWYDAGASASSVVAQHALTGVGAVSGATAPASTACVVTLQSEHAGASGRGRMYFPATAALNANHSFTGTQISTMLSQMSDFLGYVYTSSGNPWGGSLPSVLSRKNGALYPVVSLAVDGRPDRQEHRERGLVFARQAMTIGA